MQFGWFYDGHRALAPYDLRDKLKQRGYRWCPADLPNGKVWRTMTPDPEAEVAWLQAGYMAARLRFQSAKSPL